MAKTKINLGSGREKMNGCHNIDIVQIVDTKGESKVDIVMDVEKEKLPFEDNSMEEIFANNVFEHLGDGFIFALNECHRVLKEDGKLIGCVPVAGSKQDFMDPTHKRHFIKDTFGYFTGVNLADETKPYKPKYADYGIKPWVKHSLKTEDNLIWFELSPRKA